jgi:hypothetical protein
MASPCLAPILRLADVSAARQLELLRRRDVALTCSSLGPSRANVQPASNTEFESVLSGLERLDKMTVRQHAVEASLKKIRFGFDGFELGLGHEVRDRVAGGGSPVVRS